MRSWRAPVKLALITEDNKVTFLLSAGGEENLSKGDLLAIHLCLVVVLTALLRRVDFSLGHLWKLVVVAFLLCKVDLEAVLHRGVEFYRATCERWWS